MRIEICWIVFELPLKLKEGLLNSNAGGEVVEGVTERRHFLNERRSLPRPVPESWIAG